jgi:hypothetical protein
MRDFRERFPKRSKQMDKRRRERLSKVVDVAALQAEAAGKGLRRVRQYHGNMPLTVPVLLANGAWKWIEAVLKIRPQQNAPVHNDVALVCARKPKGSKHFNLSQEEHGPQSTVDPRVRRKDEQSEASA